MWWDKHPEIPGMEGDFWMLIPAQFSDNLGYRPQIPQYGGNNLGYRPQMWWDKHPDIPGMEGDFLDAYSRSI